MNLTRYSIYNLDIKFTTYELFTSIMRTIWKYHYLQLYESAPFDTNQVCMHINTEVMRLSVLKNTYVYF
jgi:hypothetical protein